MNKKQLILWVMCSVVLIGLTGYQTKTVPPLRKVTYASKLSDEPVLVQMFDVNRETLEEVEKAIVRAARGREWQVSVIEPGLVETKLVHRRADSTLQFKFDAQRIEIYSVSYEINKRSQQRIKRAEPDAWIRNLHKDILLNLGLLAKK